MKTYNAQLVAIDEKVRPARARVIDERRCVTQTLGVASLAGRTNVAGIDRRSGDSLVTRSCFGQALA